MKLHTISLSNLKRRKAKMLFLAMGLIIGISTIVTLLSITESMTRDIEERLNQFGANIIMVPRSDHLALSYGGIDVGGVSYTVKEIDESTLPGIRTIENSKNLGVVAPKVLGAVDVKGRTVLLMGILFEEEMALKTWWQFEGSFPSSGDELLLGADTASALGVRPGDPLTVAQRSFRVAGVLHPTGASEDNVLMTDLHVAQKILGKEGKISLVEIAAFCRGCPISEMTLQIAEKFPQARVTAMKQAVMSKMQSIEIFRSFSLGVSLIVVVIGSLLVLVTMMGSVNERTREIGIFRAIGFRRGHVMQIILLEAMILGILGGVLGFASGNAIAWGVMPLVLEGGTHAGVNPTLGLVSILTSVTLSLLAGLYPAFKASSLDPSEALRAL
jgi:putative ABC transport system permease protein